MPNSAPSRAPSVEVIEQIISAVTVTQIVTVNTLHAADLIDRKHFAHAFARAIDALAANPRNSLLIAILQVIKSAAMQAGPGEQTDSQARLRKLLDGERSAGEDEGK